MRYKKSIRVGARFAVGRTCGASQIRRSSRERDSVKISDVFRLHFCFAYIQLPFLAMFRRAQRGEKFDFYYLLYVSQWNAL